MKLKLRIGVALAALGWSASPAMAEPGQSLSDAINGLLTDGCGAGGTGQRLLSAAEFEQTRTFTPTSAPILNDLEVQRTVRDNDLFGITQTGGFVDNWIDNKDDIFSLTFTGEAASADPSKQIAYSLGITLPGVDDPETPSIDEGFDPSVLAGTNLQDRDDINPNAVRVRADISQRFDIRTAFAPNAQLGSGLASLCSSSITQAGQELSGTYGFDFSFNNSPAFKPGTPGASTAGAIGSPSTVSSSRGLAAIQAQEGVSRRRDGLSALVDRLSRKAKRARREEARMQSYKVASLDPVGPPRSPVPTTASARVVFDAAVGIVNIDRSATTLEGSFSADSVVANIGGGVVLEGPFQSDDQALFGLGLTVEHTTSDQSGEFGAQASSFESDAITVSAFTGWTSQPVGTPDSLRVISVVASAAYGDGDQSYDREFDFFRGASLPGAQPDASNTLEGDVKQTFTSASVQAGLVQTFGAVAFAPRASASYVKFETDGYAESVRAGENDNGLALEYAPVEDEWTEVRIGGTVSYSGQLSNRALWEVALGVDSVFVLDAETPDRTAFFAQDLRGAGRVPIIYSVDDLDDQYYDVTASVSASFSNGVQPSLSLFSRQGHDFIDAQGVLLGIRLNY